MLPLRLLEPVYWLRGANALSRRGRGVRRSLSQSHLPQDGLTLSSFTPKQPPKPESLTSSQLSPHHAEHSENPAPQTFAIETYGCQMNVSDTEIVRAVLLEAGKTEVQSAADADVVLLNTCAIRDNAEKKIWHRLSHLSHVRKKRGLTVGVLGCMAERLKTRMLEGGQVDLIAGPDSYRDLPRLLDIVAAEGEEAVNVQLSQDETYADITPVRAPKGGGLPISAFVSIMRGCNNMCAFCVVPFTRGTERSRPLESIVDEVRSLSDQGVKEVTLLGQNVNSYHDKSPDSLLSYPDSKLSVASGFHNNFNAKSRHGAGARFADLLHQVADIDPEMRIRYTSPHPKDFPTEVVEAIKTRHNICKQLHMPAQSGSSTVLERMRRGYSREAYIALVQQVRREVPGVALSSDFICGFCGESEEDHEDTLSLMREVGYDQCFMFAYSLREKTRAAHRMSDDVSPEVKSRRLQEVIDTFYSAIAEKNEALEVGRVHTVLVEGQSKRSTPEAPQLTGRTDTNKRVAFAMHQVAASVREPNTMVDLKPGDYASVVITGTRKISLVGRAVSRTTLTEACYDPSNSPVPSRLR
ncbi:unnamed protein product [Chrysoparadoxa australica]